MLREDRLLKITQRLILERRVQCDELADEFDISLATVRLDLSELEKRGIAKRVYGGAVVAEQETIHPLQLEEKYLMDRFNFQRMEKEAIGRAAAALVADGETVMVDGGTTTCHVIANLSNRKGLTIISNVFNNLWQDLVTRSNIDIFLTGGFLRPQSFSLVGEVAETMIRGFRANKAILGIDGISLEHGFTAVNIMEAGIKKRMIASSQQVIFVADHTKFGKVGLVPVAAMESPCMTLVTGEDAPLEFINAIRDHGIQVLFAAS